MDDIHPMLDIRTIPDIIRICFTTFTQGLGQRDNGCDGVHDLVRQDTDQFLPSLHLIPLQGRMDVLQADDPTLATSQVDTSGIDRPILRNGWFSVTHHRLPRLDSLQELIG